MSYWVVFVAALGGAFIGGLAAHLITRTKPELIELDADSRLVEIDQRQLDHLLVMMERLSAQIDVGGATGLRIEHAAEGVAADLADAHLRANGVGEGEPGAAADAAVRQVVEDEPGPTP